MMPSEAVNRPADEPVRCCGFRCSLDAPSVDFGGCGGCGGCGGGSGAPEGRGNSRAERKLRHKAESNGQPCKGWRRKP